MMAHGFADLEDKLASGDTQTFRLLLLLCSCVNRGLCLLLHDSELLHKDGSKLLDQMGTVGRVLELDDDSLDNLVVDALKVHLYGNKIVVRVVLHVD